MSDKEIDIELTLPGYANRINYAKLHAHDAEYNDYVRNLNTKDLESEARRIIAKLRKNELDFRFAKPTSKQGYTTNSLLETKEREWRNLDHIEALKERLAELLGDGVVDKIYYNRVNTLLTWSTDDLHCIEIN